MTASPYFRPSGINRALFLQVDNLAYCSIAKTGSTLWKRILYYIRTNQVNRNLYEGCPVVLDIVLYLNHQVSRNLYGGCPVVLNIVLHLNLQVSWYLYGGCPLVLDIVLHLNQQLS